MNLKSELELTQAAGGMVGDTTREAWTELLERQGGGMVRMAIGKLRAKTRARQVTVVDIALAMKHKLTAPVALPKEQQRTGLNDGPPLPDQKVGIEEEHAPTPAPEPQPATEQLGRGRPGNQGQTGPKRIDYVAILSAGTWFSKADIAAEAGVSEASVHVWLKRHAELVEFAMSGRKKLYWLKGSAPAPARAPEREAAPAEPADGRDGAAEPDLAPEPAVTPPPARQSAKPRPQSPQTAATAPEACAAPCAGCQRLGIELAKALLEKDALQPAALRRQLTALSESLAEVRTALTAVEA